MAESLLEEAKRILFSDTCVCGKPKVKNQSFCRGCYFALPGRLRSELYKSFSDGYAEIWDEAREYIKNETDRMSAGRLF
jgi:hypothetical protein